MPVTRIRRNLGQSEASGNKINQPSNGLYIHSSPPRALQVSSAHIKQLIRNGDIDKLEQLVLDGHGKKLVGEYSADYKTRTFLKNVPTMMSKISLLHDAVNSGRLEELQAILDEEPEKKRRLVMCKDEAGVGLLHKAVYYDLKDIYKYLIDKYSHVVSMKDSEGRTAYHYTPMCRDTAGVQKLLKNAGADSSCLDYRQHSAKYYGNHPQELELPNAQKSISSTKRSNSNQSDSLNFKKSNIRIWIHQRNLANLQQVVWEGHGSKLLVEHSNNPKIKKFLEAVPHIMGLVKDIHTDVQNDELENLKSRLNPPIPPIVLSGRDANGLTPLHKAAGLGRYEMAEFMVNCFPKGVNLTDCEGRTPLHYAALLKDDDKMTNLLLENGADESVLDNRQKTAAYYKTRSSEIDTKVLNVIPECPRAAKESFLSGFDWSMLLTNVPTEEIKKVAKKIANGVSKDEENGEPIQNGEETQNGDEKSSVDDNQNVEEVDNATEEEPPAPEEPEATVEVNESKDDENNNENNEDEKSEEENEAQPDEEANAAENDEVQVEGENIEPEKEEAPEEEETPVVEEPEEEAPEEEAPDEGENIVEEHENVENAGNTEIAQEETNEAAEEHNADLVDDSNNDPEPHDDTSEDPDKPAISRPNTRTQSRPASHMVEEAINQIDEATEDHAAPPQTEVDEPEGVIEGVVNGENEVETLNEQGQGVAESDDDEITNLVENGNMEQLAALVLNGEGQKLIGRKSDNYELQSFLDNVSVYMSKINRIHLAARNGSLRDLQAALDRRKFAIAKDKISPNGASPLHTAVVFGNTSIVRYLAGRFPETAEVVDDNGRSPLHYAAVLPDNGHYYNLMVHLGADSRAEDKFGHTPEYYRTHNNEFSHKSLLRDFGVEESASEEILNDKVPNDTVSARKDLDDEDMLSVLERCYNVLHGRRNSNTISAASVATTKSSTTSSQTLQGNSANPLISKHMRRYIFDAVKTRVTKLDHNLYDLIWPSVKKLPTDLSFRNALEQDFPAGIVAPDVYVYRVFAEFMEPIVKESNSLDSHLELGVHPEPKFADIDIEDDITKLEVNLDLDPQCQLILADNHVVPSNGQADMPFFATEEGRYLASTLGDPLIKGLTEVANKRPEDPIAYLATYLYNFANNRQTVHSRGKTQENQQMITGSPQKVDDNTAVPASIDVVTVEPEDGSSEEDSAFSSTARDEHGQSMLHFAAARSHGRNALFQLLLETEINVAYRDELYRTARDISIQANIPENTIEIDRYVMYIATKGDTDKLVELLLDGYDHITDIIDEDDIPIIEAVAQHSQPDTVSFLQSILAFEEKRERVHHAIRLGSINDVTSLLADENETGSGKLLAIGKNSYGRCSLHIAVLCQQEEISDYLANTFPETLKLGDNLERTALHYAMGIEKMETISRVLIKAGAKRVVKDLKGRQPTYYFLNKSDILRLQEEEETF